MARSLGLGMAGITLICVFACVPQDDIAPPRESAAGQSTQHTATPVQLAPADERQGGDVAVSDEERSHCGAVPAMPIQDALFKRGVPNATIVTYVTDVSWAIEARRGGQALGCVTLDGFIGGMSGVLSDKGVKTGFTTQPIALLVIPKTKVYVARGSERLEPTIEDIEAGHTISASFVAPVLDAGFLRCLATRVAILNEPGIRGRITELIVKRSGPVVARAMVQAGDLPSRLNRAWVWIRDGTKLYVDGADGRRDATLDDLQVGQTVEVQFFGPLATSDPPLGGAFVLVVTAQSTSSPRFSGDRMDRR